MSREQEPEGADSASQGGGPELRDRRGLLMLLCDLSPPSFQLVTSPLCGRAVPNVRRAGELGRE